MAKTRYPVTPAIRILREAGISISHHLYDYQQGGGAQQGAEALGVEPHRVIKTLIMEDHRGSPLIVLMHGDREVATGLLARTIGARWVAPCDPTVATRHSGYQVGGTSPFGTRKTMPVYLEKSILELTELFINGGKRGYLIGMGSGDLQRLLQPTLVSVAMQAGG